MSVTCDQMQQCDSARHSTAPVWDGFLYSKIGCSTRPLNGAILVFLPRHSPVNTVVVLEVTFASIGTARIVHAMVTLGCKALTYAEADVVKAEESTEANGGMLVYHEANGGMFVDHTYQRTALSFEHKSCAYLNGNLDPYRKHRWCKLCYELCVRGPEALDR